MEQKIVVDDCKMPPYNDALLQLLDMGFGERQAQLAIVHTNGDIGRAMEYLLSGGNDNTNDNDGNDNNKNNDISQRQDIEEPKAKAHHRYHHHRHRHRHRGGKGHHHHNHGKARSSEVLEKPDVPTFPRDEPSTLRDTFQTCSSNLHSFLDPTIGSGVKVNRRSSDIDSTATVCSGMMGPKFVEKKPPTDILQIQNIEGRTTGRHGHHQHRHRHRHHSGKDHQNRNQGEARSSEALENPYIPTFPIYAPSTLRDTFQTTYPTFGSGVGVDRDNSEVDSVATVCSGMMGSPMEVLGCRGCCNYPNGKMGIAAVCVSVVSFSLATVSSYSCTFFKLGETGFYLGLFSYQVPLSNCLKYDGKEESLGLDGGPWKFARAMAILATIFGTLALVATFSLSCMSMPNLILKIVSMFSLISALCVILTLVAKTNCDENVLGDSCKLSSGGVLAIVAPFFYVVLSIIFYKIPLYESDSNVSGSKPTQDEQVPGNSVIVEEPPYDFTVLNGSRRRAEREYVDETDLMVHNVIDSRTDNWHQPHHSDVSQLPHHAPPLSLVQEVIDSRTDNWHQPHHADVSQLPHHSPPLSPVQEVIDSCTDNRHQPHHADVSQPRHSPPVSQQSSGRKDRMYNMYTISLVSDEGATLGGVV